MGVVNGFSSERLPPEFSAQLLSVGRFHLRFQQNIQLSGRSMRAAKFPWPQKIHSRSQSDCRFGKVSKNKAVLRNDRHIPT